MVAELQRASLWKRFSAFLLDLILLAILTTGLLSVLSNIFQYESYNDTVLAAYEKYETQYGVSLTISAEDFAVLTPEQQALHQEAYDALVADQEAMYAFNMSVSVILMCITLSLLLSYLLLEFVVPLLFKDGRTVGKKVFSLGIVRYDGVRMNNMQLFVRAMLGKFTVGTMIPVYIVILIFLGKIGLLGSVLLLILAATQVILILATRDHTPLQDKMAGTVVVDIASQRVFETTEDLIAYTKRIHAERAERQDY